MDRRQQQLVQRTRQVFGDRLDDVVAMVRQDRQELRGWEEPGHLRAVLRRSARQGNAGQADGPVTTAVETDFARTAGEPDPGQQREALGQLLEAGANGVERLARGGSPDLTPEERLGLECVLLLYGRPALLIRDGRLAPVPAFWNLLEDQRDDIEMVQRGVGRIELFGHPEYDWAGSGFLVGETTLLTSRRVAELFVERQGEAFQFRPGITAWLDYRAEEERQASAGCRVRGVIGVHKDYDLALLDVEPPQNPSGSAPTILALAAQAPERLEGRPVYQVSYPIRDTRRSEPERVARICRDVYNVKRVQPGVLRGAFQFGPVQLLTHDCGGLGHSAGGCVVDLETHQVLGLQTTGRYLENSTAVPLWVLRDDPLFRQARVNFAQASPQDVERTNDEIERLARTPYWKDLRQVITALYQRAFGRGDVGE